MKKIIATILALALIGGSAACSSVPEVVEIPVTQPTESVVLEITEPTEEVTEAPTEEATEAPTEEVTEAPTEAETEAPTEKATEAPKPTEPKATEAPKPTEPKATEAPKPVHTHSYSEKTVAPTCEKKGYTKHTCSCGDSFKDNYVDAIGHSYNTETVAATTESKGYDKHTCSNCGDSYKDNYTEKVKVEDKLDLNAAMEAGNAYALQIGFGSIDYSLTMSNAGFYPYSILPSSALNEAVEAWGYATRQDFLVKYARGQMEACKSQLEGAFEANGEYDASISHFRVRCYIYYDAGQDSYIVVALYK